MSKATGWSGMSGAAKSIFMWGVYMMFAGICFMLMPNVILPLLDFEADKEPWVLVGASLIAILGYYYVVAARHKLTPFFRATILGRFLILCWYGLLVVVHKSQWQLLLLAIPDQFGGLWTYLELKKMDAAVTATA